LDRGHSEAQQKSKKNVHMHELPSCLLRQEFLVQVLERNI